jgi:hypothetical protein
LLITEGAEKVTGAKRNGAGFCGGVGPWLLAFGLWSLVFGLWSWILGWILLTRTVSVYFEEKTKDQRPKTKSQINLFGQSFVELSRRALIELLQDSILLHRRVFVICQ